MIQIAADGKRFLAVQQPGSGAVRYRADGLKAELMCTSGQFPNRTLTKRDVIAGVKDYSQPFQPNAVARKLFRRRKFRPKRKSNKRG